MAIIKRDPFTSLFSLPSWIEDFDEMSTQRGLKISETDSSIKAEAVVAGVPSKNVHVHIEDGVLTIKAEGEKEQETEDEYTSQSYRYYYTAALSGGQWDKARAKVRDGVVKVSIPKAEAAKPRRIEIETE